MGQFKNILHYITRDTVIDFYHLTQIRRCKLEMEGFRTDSINWDHYAKVLVAKQRELKD